MRILVTGARGFTGQHFVGIARASGHEIVELLCDLRDKEALKLCVAEAAPEAVVHLAGISFVGHADVSEFYTVNVIGTLNLLDALLTLDIPPQNVLLVSSANVYGNCENSPITELQIPNPINHYGVSKLGMECLSRSYLNKLSLFFVRPFNYTGPGQAVSFLIPKLVAHFARGGGAIDLGNLEVEREFNDIRFVCEAYLRLLNNGKAGEVYNICSGKPLPLKSVITLLKEISGCPLEISINPAYIRTNEVNRLCGDPTKLIHEIGLIQAPSLRDTLQWMLESASQEIPQCA